MATNSSSSFLLKTNEELLELSFQEKLNSFSHLYIGVEDNEHHNDFANNKSRKKVPNSCFNLFYDQFSD